MRHLLLLSNLLFFFLVATILSSSSCGSKDPPLKVCWDGSKILENQSCPPQTKVCWDGSVIPINSSCPSQYPERSKWMTTQPSLSAPANPGFINPGEAKSAGSLTVANSSNVSHTTSLTFTFGGDGAAAVDSIIFVYSNVTYPKKVVNKSFTFEGVSVPANGIANIVLIYRIVPIIPSDVVDMSQIALALTALTTDEAGVNLPGTGTLPAAINLDKVKVPVISSTISAPVVTYGAPFAIIGNACSNPMNISVNNSGGAKTVSFTANFGVYGSAVKMLRYKLNGSAWTVLPAVNGVITFSNVNLQSGLNTFDCIFALKDAPMVQNGAALSFSFTNLDEGSGPAFPIGGAFNTAVPVGTVNSITQPTMLTTVWDGYTAIPDSWVVAGSDTRALFYQVTNIRATGPAGARVVSMRLRNPYTAFSDTVAGNVIGMAFDNSTWAINIQGGPDKYFSTIFWQNEFISLTLPNETSIITDGVIYNKYYVNCSYKNTSSNDFRSNVYTPGYFGFYLTTKYDLIIKNSDGQVIDLSDAVIKMNTLVLTN